jgi:hypothetical protein
MERLDVVDGKGLIGHVLIWLLLLRWVLEVGHLVMLMLLRDEVHEIWVDAWSEWGPHPVPLINETEGWDSGDEGHPPVDSHIDKEDFARIGATPLLHPEGSGDRRDEGAAHQKR